MNARQSHALEQVAGTSDFAKASVAERDSQIRAAHRLGLSLREIAAAAHLGHTTVARIVNGGGARSTSRARKVGRGG